MKIGKIIKNRGIALTITNINFNPSLEFLKRPELNVWNNVNNPNVTPLVVKLEAALGFVEAISINYKIN